ncbi:MAG: GNAT family N-acetyltransferase [Alphaproteobacteria bacterium]
MKPDTTGDGLVIADTAPTEPDAIWCRDRYFEELEARFEGGFDAGPGGAGGADGDRDMAPPAGAFVIARLADRAAGCGGVVVRRPADGPAFAEIKRMWVDDALRGRGVGYRILLALEDRTRMLGQTLVRLDSHRSLEAAHALYRRCGYGEIARYNDNPYAHLWFEKRLG